GGRRDGPLPPHSPERVLIATILRVPQEKGHRGGGSTDSECDGTGAGRIGKLAQSGSTLGMTAEGPVLVGPPAAPETELAILPAHHDVGPVSLEPHRPDAGARSRLRIGYGGVANGGRGTLVAGGTQQGDAQP